MKKHLLSLFAVLLSCSTWAYDVGIDGIYYIFNTDTKEAEVTYKDNNYNSYSGDVVIPSSVTYSDVTYSVVSIGGNAFADCTGLTSVVIPNSVTSIGRAAFASCSGLPSVLIPNSVTSIGDCAFQDCTSLTSIDIPENVTSISVSAFAKCSGLTSVMLPASVTEIAGWAFAYCSNLTAVSCEAPTPPVCGSNCFYQVDQSACSLYVPAESVDAYKSADQWKEFYNILPFKPTGIQVNGQSSTVNVQYFDFEGREIPAFQKGMNIVKYSDGTTKKLFKP